jgi:hypothetical protein
MDGRAKLPKSEDSGSSTNNLHKLSFPISSNKNGNSSISSIVKQWANDSFVLVLEDPDIPPPAYTKSPETTEEDPIQK